MSRRLQTLVLCYHALSEAWPSELAVRPSAFPRQLRSLLVRGYVPASLEESLDGSRKSVHVTFDDAYASVTAALPVLEALRIPATIFACTRYARDGRPLAVPELERDVAAYPDELATMDWDGLAAAVDRGVEVGSHTVSHPHLATLDDGDLAREVADSRTEIEDRLGQPCRFLAYPYGESDARIRAAARRAGYKGAVGLGRAPRTPVDRFEFPRIELSRKDTLVRATLKTSRVYDAVTMPGRERPPTRRSRS